METIQKKIKKLFFVGKGKTAGRVDEKTKELNIVENVNVIL